MDRRMYRGRFKVTQRLSRPGACKPVTLVDTLAPSLATAEDIGRIVASRCNGVQVHFHNIDTTVYRESGVIVTHVTLTSETELQSIIDALRRAGEIPEAPLEGGEVR